MRPVGLTLKRIAKKYASPIQGEQGELMLVHLCEACGKVSINRIAVDDDNETILAVLEESASLDAGTRALLAQDGVTPLSTAQADLVRRRLLGISVSRGETK
jgi:hypothetical protein